MTSTEDQLQATEACQVILEATGCDYMICLFPKKDGAEEIIRASIHLENLVGHFNSVAEQTAQRLGITREQALRKMADVGSMTRESISLD